MQMLAIRVPARNDRTSSSAGLAARRDHQSETVNARRRFGSDRVHRVCPALQALGPNQEAIARSTNETPDHHRDHDHVSDHASDQCE